MSEKIQVTLYHRMGAGSYGVGDTFEEAHAIAWEEWHKAFGGQAPASTAIDPAPYRTDENLRATRIAPLLREDAYADDEDGPVEEKTLGFFEDFECFLGSARDGIRSGDLHRARAELRHLTREIFDLDATLAHHQREDS